MKDYIYTLQISTDHPRSLTLPYIFSSTSSLTFLSFGTRHTACENIEIHYTYAHQIIIGEQIAKELLLPSSTAMHAFIQNQTLILGPLIGIFTTGFTESASHPVGNRSISFKDLLIPPDPLHPFVFLFGAQHINWDEETIDGYFFKEESWVQCKVPFPNVIYDRLPNRQAESYKPIIRAKKRLQTKYAIPWFNPGFFNKWNIHELLINEKTVASLLPQTETFQHFEQVERFLSSYKHVYMKSVHGSFGRSIYQILYSTTESCYYCRYHEGKQNKFRKYHSLETLINHVMQGQDLKEFIVQQGIVLLRIGGQPVDFRIHTNKNRFGNWRISAIVAKIAGKGSMTTHINSGGEVKLLQDIFPDATERIRITNKLTDVAMQLSSTLDRCMKGNIGEIGFDLGLDKNEKVWLFEANSKPGRTVFQSEELQEYDELTKQLFYEYAIYLTESSLSRSKRQLPKDETSTR
ncbi:YheC/YheD family protein [Bacillus sp. Xin]|uniref:YheC/YheD family endospore coat-associated protein n=1 Tax=unclassified Bacillus (in: firmicutes) TaxID=185979 RepID=UPI00157371B3|nr:MULTISPECIES: YheC/YheD family protein [unclassified Bacillus (in: firmicutes)]MBC6975354.1 YheC/YheD family protein [Bacillus sp. Xin]NSW37597.1 YheC/YheD family protein [Bacillus sp. Xin1]